MQSRFPRPRLFPASDSGLRDDQRSVVVWGASGHARVVADALVASGGRVAAFYVDVDVGNATAEFEGRPVVVSPADLERLLQSGVTDAIAAIGDNRVRTRCSATLRSLGFELLRIVHPSAVVSPSARFEAGTFLAAGSILNPGARVGRDVIVNTGASVDHDCVVEDGAHLSPGVRLSGRVRVERLAWLGTGAVVKDGITIGEGSIVGAGAVAVRDVPPGVVVYGNPARVRRSLEGLGG